MMPIQWDSRPNLKVHTTDIQLIRLVASQHGYSLSDLLLSEEQDYRGIDHPESLLVVREILEQYMIRRQTVSAIVRDLSGIPFSLAGQLFHEDEVARGNAKSLLTNVLGYEHEFPELATLRDAGSARHHTYLDESYEVYRSEGRAFQSIPATLDERAGLIADVRHQLQEMIRCQKTENFEGVLQADNEAHIVCASDPTTENTMRSEFERLRSLPVVQRLCELAKNPEPVFYRDVLAPLISEMIAHHRRILAWAEQEHIFPVDEAKKACRRHRKTFSETLDLVAKRDPILRE